MRSLFLTNKWIHLVSLARKNNVPVLAVTETLPSGKTYKTWMLSQYQQLYKIISTTEN